MQDMMMLLPLVLVLYVLQDTSRQQLVLPSVNCVLQGNTLVLLELLLVFFAVLV